MEYRAEALSKSVSSSPASCRASNASPPLAAAHAGRVLRPPGRDLTPSRPRVSPGLGEREPAPQRAYRVSCPRLHFHRLRALHGVGEGDGVTVDAGPDGCRYDRLQDGVLGVFEDEPLLLLAV